MDTTSPWGRRLATLALALAVGAAAALTGPGADATGPGTDATEPADAAPAPRRAVDEVFPDLTVARGERYGQAERIDGVTVDLLLDRYEPAGDTAARRPAIVWVHGGGFAGGDRASDQAATLAERFAHLGYVTVSIDYRLLPTGGCDGASGVSAECERAAADGIADGQAAVRWLRAHATELRVDPDRIGIGGISAGGIIATGVGLLADRPAPGSNPGPSSAVTAFASVSGGLPGGLGASADDAPGVLFSGPLDDIVPYAWSADTAEALQGAGVAAELVTLDGAGHVPWDDFGEAITQRSIELFADRLAETPVDQEPPSTTIPPTVGEPADGVPPSTTPPGRPSPGPAAARPVRAVPSYAG